MIEALTIYTDRLKEGHVEEIHEEIPSALLDINDKDLRFADPIHIEGEAYIADEELLIHLNVNGEAILPCSICNGDVHLPIVLENLYLAQPLAECKTKLFDLKEFVRESLLLEVPQFAECHEGKCPERETLTPFLKSEENSTSEGEEAGHNPFTNLLN